MDVGYFCHSLRMMWYNHFYVIKFPCSRGDSGALYLQSALAGVMSHLGQSVAELPCVSGDDVWVLRNRAS